MIHRQCLFRCLAPNRSLPLLFLWSLLLLFGGSSGDSAVKNPPADSGDVGGVGSVPWERSNQEGTATHSSILAGRATRTEEPGGLRSTGSQSQTGLSAWPLSQSVIITQTECYCLVRPTRWGLGTTAPSSHSLDEWQTRRNSDKSLETFFHMNIRKCRELYSL